jgi:hypothetical protein
MRSEPRPGLFDACDTFSELLVVMRQVSPNGLPALIEGLELSRKQLRGILRDVRKVGLNDLVELVEATLKTAKPDKPTKSFDRLKRLGFRRHHGMRRMRHKPAT